MESPLFWIFCCLFLFSLCNSNCVRVLACIVDSFVVMIDFCCAVGWRRCTRITVSFLHLVRRQPNAPSPHPRLRSPCLIDAKLVVANAEVTMKRAFLIARKLVALAQNSTSIKNHIHRSKTVRLWAKMSAKTATEA